MRSATGNRGRDPPRSIPTNTRSRASTPPSRAVTSGKSKSPAPLRFHFVGGKGGVGKTTCSAAFAVVAARAARVLVASTDPAPSLADALGIALSSVPRKIPLRSGSLHAVEIDAAQALSRWIAERRSSLETIALQGTWLDKEDVSKLLALSLPGIDEVAALLELERLASSGRFDLLIVDTAPTGHTLRMLAMPETLFGIASVFDRMRDKHRAMVEALRGSARREREDALIEELAAAARGLAAMLRDGNTTRLSWVTLPEPMALAETADALAALETYGMVIDDLIVNRLTPAPSSTVRDARCGHCNARRAFEGRALRTLPKTSARVLSLLARDTEPRGVLALRRIGEELEKGNALAGKGGAGRGRWAAALDGDAVHPAVFMTDETRLLMFGGKGGVGKTTCAAAAALAAAARWPGRRVLVISADPAHSLGDVFGLPLSDEPLRVPHARGHLMARELDAARVLDTVKQRYATAIDRLFDRFAGGGSLDAGHDRSVMHALIDLAPPGLDELAATIEMTDAISGSDPAWDLAVIDTAPTGHALRLLEMPALIHDWTRALMSILLKYQPVTGLGDLGTLLLKLSRGIGRLRDLLADRRVTRFVVVTRAAALPRAESVRLVKRLGGLGIEVPALVVNAVGRGSCVRCRKADVAERREISALRRSVAPAAAERIVVRAATWIPSPHGAPQLARWQRTAWRQ